jgi:hypothetical protein
MSDPRAAIEAGLVSSNPENVYDALIDIGKQGHRDLADRVVPYLTSPTDFLREAAIRTLAFYLHLPAHKADAMRMLDSDPDEGVRQAAAMGLRAFAMDPLVMQQLLRVALKDGEDETVREAAFIAALVAAGIQRDEFPMGRWLPGFDDNADWPLLERALRVAGIPVPPGVAQPAARPR